MSACVCIDLSFTNTATNCIWQQYNSDKRERGRKRNSFYCCQFGWKRITRCCQKMESQDNLVFCQIPWKSTQTFGFYIPKQVYCPRHSGCCDSMERRFALSERLWPVHSECRITQVLLLHPLPPASIYAHEASVRWFLILPNTVYASQRPESPQFFCVHIVNGCPSKSAMTHSHPLQDTFMSSPLAATATLPRFDSFFCF